VEGKIAVTLVVVVVVVELEAVMAAAVSVDMLLQAGEDIVMIGPPGLMPFVRRASDAV
jgi:hypothetical protein